MKDVSLLTFLTQLGLGVALPLVGFVFLSVWLRDQFGWGNWVVVLGTILGLLFAADGLYWALKTMNRLVKKDKGEKPPVSFNDHD